MSQQSNPATLRELVRRWNEVASKIANRPTSTPETRAQATGWKQCADELEEALAASGTEAAPTKRIIVTHPSQMSAEALDAGAISEYVDVPAQAAASPEGEGREITLERIIEQQNRERAAIIAENKRNYEELDRRYGICRDEIIKLRHELDAALRQPAAPSGGAALWNAAKERERLALQIAEDLMAQNMLNVPCVNAFHVINATLFTQESQTGAVTETK